MIRKILLFIILIQACTNTSNNTPLKLQAVVSKMFAERNKNRKCFLDTESSLKYGNFNFILTDSNWVFIHTRNAHFYGNKCIKNEEDSLIDYIDLSPDDFVTIEISNLNSFLQTNLPDSLFVSEANEKINPFVIIANEKDSIYSPAYSIIRQALKMKRIRNWNVRLLTEEEKNVLN